MTTDRGWPNHVRVEAPSGLDRASRTVTEQLRTLSRDRLAGVASEVSIECLATTRTWLGDFLDLRSARSALAW
jgi:mRNA interferase MazF